MKMNNVIAMNTNERLYNVVMNNLKQVGRKFYADVPVELLFVDGTFQRTGETSKNKIKNLAAKWNPDKMDALRVVPHPENKSFSVVDGYHRKCAAEINGQESLECEIVLGLSENPEERLVQEATLFATQNDEIDTLTPQEKHNANVIRKIKENIILQELVDKYDIPLKKPTGRGLAITGQLAGFTMALSIAKSGGKEKLDRVFYVLCSSRWNITRNGLCSVVLNTVYNIHRLHPAHEKEITELLIEHFTKIEPEHFLAEAYAKYPSRKEKERTLLVAEDMVCEKLGIERVYNGGNVALTLAAMESVA